MKTNNANESLFNKQDYKLSNKQKISTLKNIIRIIWKHHKYIWMISLVLIVIGSGGLLYNQVFIGKIIIDGFLVEFSKNPSAQEAAKFNFYKFYLIVGLSALWFFVTVLAGFIWKRLLIKATNNILSIMRSDLYKHIQSLPISFFDSNAKGDLMARFSSDIEALRDFISNSLPRVIDTFITLLVSVIVMFSLDWILALIMIFVMLLILLFSFLIAKQSKKGFAYRQKSNGALSGFTEEVVGNLRTIKIFSQENQIFSNYQKFSESLYKGEIKSRGYSDLLFPFSIWMGNVGYIIVAIFGAILLVRGNGAGLGLSIGILISFTQFAKSFSGPVSSIMDVANSIIIALAGGKRVFDIFTAQPEVDRGKIKCVKVIKQNEQYYEISDPKNTDAIWVYKFSDSSDWIVKYKEVVGNIVFDDVSFAYNQKATLKNISFSTHKGQKVALVGPTGAGKTTITSLLIRFYEPSSGQISIDGIDIQDIEKSSLRKIIGIILQDATLFTDTIANNISYGDNEELNIELLNSSIYISNLQEHINKLSEKEKTHLADRGNKLSQGQKQLITIARATYKNPPILIFDEATSNIDTITEYQIQKAMDKVIANRTTFIIAHRLSTIKNADLILVINDGKIIEAGNHQELLEFQGQYYQLWMNAQSRDQ
ncbi:ATP-binding cassette subfamily B protein [Mycoplasmopsis mustelae]|uniref:ATP-binding cassette subfamily B protein n=1 Tax=Mycoplasmopsis mustelae TaxID=171289 RepID=A0A4R7UE71_9BACT|nr:ABC transporter ATP-binding protein [Mycoplasmopsis mustelae]TDV23047.1 ATP-binding cassette subfamily B protein [Mycoplasmopsis mustelae]